MKSKKVMAMMMTLLLMTSGVIGCSKSETTSTSSEGKGTQEKKEEAPTVADDGREVVGNMYVEGLPIVKEKESFSILVDGGTTDYNGSDFLKMMEKETNVEVKILSYPYEVALEKKNILLNSGEYPDAMGGWIVGESDAMKYGVKEQVFIPIEEMIEKYAPKMTEVLDMEGVRAAMTLPDGHIYSIPYVVPEPQVVFGPWINQKWLDQLGIQMPTTTDELYDVLVAFKTQDPNGNGKNDEIPFGMRADHMYNIFGWFGQPEGIYLVDGEPTFTATTEEYKEGIKYFNKLYTEGLLDPELFTQDINQFNAKGKEVDAVYGAAILYAPSDIGEQRMEDYVPLPPIQTSTGKEPVWRRGSLGQTTFRTQLFITDNAKNPETIIRWYNHLYETDNSIQASNGLYGIGIEKTLEGYKLLENDKSQDPNYMGAQFPGALPKYIPNQERDKIEVNEQSRISAGQNDALDETYANNFAEYVPPVWLTEEESKAIATIGTDINKYVKDKRAAWVSGQADVEAEWNEFLAQLDKLGLPKLMEVRGAAIKRTLGR